MSLYHITLSKYEVGANHAGELIRRYSPLRSKESPCSLRALCDTAVDKRP